MRHSMYRRLALAVIVILLAPACSVSPGGLTIGGGGEGGGGGGDAGTTSTTASGGGAGGGATATTSTTTNGGGGGIGTGGGGIGTGGGATIDPEVERLLASFGPWRARNLPPFEDDRNLQPYQYVTADRVKVSCELSDRAIPATVFTEFAAFPFSGDKLPGLIVEGSGIEQGDLKVLPLGRSPLPLVVNLASENPSVVVDNPDPSSLQGAVAELMRTADARLSGLPVVPANVRFFHREVSSYEEASLNMGVSLRYQGGGFRGKFESDFEQSTTSERHTVMARLLQPMFTISVDKSKVSGAGDYFDHSTTGGEVEALVGGGRVGPGNPPVLIDAVTYGRVVYMTVTSDKVTSADELKIAVSGAYGGFSGDAEVAAKNRRIMQESEIKVEALGGDEDVALRALRDGTIQAFMESVNTSTAAPLSMVLRTLDGTKLSMTDQATVTDIGCRREALPNNVEIQITTNDDVWGVLYVNGSRIRTVKTSERIDISDRLRAGGNDEVSVFFDTGLCIGGTMNVSFLVNGQTYQNTQWRLEGTAGTWVCDETVTWTVSKGDGTVRQISGPPALQVIR